MPQFAIRPVAPWQGCWSLLPPRQSASCFSGLWSRARSKDRAAGRLWVGALCWLFLLSTLLSQPLTSCLLQSLSRGTVLLVSSHSSHWGGGIFFFFLMKQFQLLSQGPLIQSHPKHSRLSAFSRNSESTGSCQRDNFSLLHGNLLFLVRITLSPRGQVTHVHGSQLPHPCAVFTWGREHHSASWGRNCPRARGTDIFSISLPTCNPPRWPTDPPGG